mmetsp:Transcript_16030/g.30501  ORF Transcript_16030/g.30501 Transcript_16030/m.30501 type:complete len:144 (-) Transcript_16030:304-735(-)
MRTSSGEAFVIHILVYLLHHGEPSTHPEKDGMLSQCRVDSRELTSDTVFENLTLTTSPIDLLDAFLIDGLDKFCYTTVIPSSFVGIDLSSSLFTSALSSSNWYVSSKPGSNVVGSIASDVNWALSSPFPFWMLSSVQKRDNSR